MRKAITLFLTLLVCAAAHRFTQAFSSTAPVADEPVYVVTHVDVMPKFTAPGRELLKHFAAESGKEPGAVRIEVLESRNRPSF